METATLKTHATPLIRKTFPVLEMTCAACAVSVESMLKATPGVAEAAVNFANQTAFVAYDTNTTAPLRLREAVQGIGYDLVIDEANAESIQKQAQQNHYNNLKQRTVWSVVLAIPVVVLGMFFMDVAYSSYISMLLAAPVIFFLGRTYFINAWKQARHGKANMDTLVALSTGIAFVFSAFNTFYPDFWHQRGLHAHVYYEAAVVVIAFISLGKLLEERAKANTSSALKKLMGLRPKTVKVKTVQGEQEVPVEMVKVGDILIVRPGERIAVDGVVVAGSSYVDESMISGEPIAAIKQKGAAVYAGTVNQKGSFEFEAEKVGAETILAHIINMVRQAQGSKAPVQNLVDKVAGIFVPVVIGIAVLTFAVWMIVGGADALTHALVTSVSVLVIACPCALGLATPTAIMVGIGKSAENNILIKDAESLEVAHRVDTVILDKTGTITEGKPVVTDLHWLVSEAQKLTLQPILLGIELRSEHPLAEAVVESLKSLKVEPLAIDNFESITARGAKGNFGQATYYIGNEALLQEQAIPLTEAEQKIAGEWRSQAKTVVFFADDTKALAIIAIADKIKDTSREAVQRLQAWGIEAHMLTGDNAQTASSVASHLGIAHVQANLLPSDKARIVKELQEQGKVVAMVGDGINDSQALAQADISIAMGKGSDIAMDVAKMTLITADLRAVPRALRLSAYTVKGIRQNLFWAFIYNVVGIPLAAGVLFPINGFLLNPMIAGAAMALSSVSVVANSLRLKAVKL